MYLGLPSPLIDNTMEIDYAEIVTSKPVSKFLLKFYLSDIEIESLILVSPFVGTLEGTRVTLDGICKKAIEKNIPMYVITLLSKISPNSMIAP